MSYTAFAESRQIASGSLLEIARAVRLREEAGDSALVLIFDDESGRQLDIDIRGSAAELEQRFAPAPEPEDPPATESASAREDPPAREGQVRRPGRPRLGVVGREVTLLPRHWEWLGAQRGSPSATLRRLVDRARAASASRDQARQAQDAVNRFISAVAGDLPGFEEANRALYRGDAQRFASEIESWPEDLRRYLARWVARAFAPPTTEGQNAQTSAD